MKLLELVHEISHAPENSLAKWYYNIFVAPSKNRMQTFECYQQQVEEYHNDLKRQEKMILTKIALFAHELAQPISSTLDYAIGQQLYTLASGEDVSSQPEVEKALIFFSSHYELLGNYCRKNLLNDVTDEQRKLVFATNYYTEDKFDKETMKQLLILGAFDSDPTLNELLSLYRQLNLVLGIE